MRPLLGNGLVTADRETHRRHRRLIQPSFSPARLAGYADLMRQGAREEVDGWSDGQAIEVYPAMFHYMAGILVRTLVPTRMGDEARHELRRALPIIVRGIQRKALSPIPERRSSPSRTTSASRGPFPACDA